MSAELNVLVIGDQSPGLLVDGGEQTIVISEGEQGPPGIGLKGDKGDKGDSGDLGTDLHFEYVQRMASQTWDVYHGLGKYPAVTVRDSTGEEVEGDYRYPDANNVTLLFAYPFAGTASFN